LLLIGLGIGATPFISILKDLLNNSRDEQTDNEFSRSDFSWNSCTSSYTTATPTSTHGGKKKAVKAHFYWVTREPGSVEWFRGVMEEISDMDCRVILNTSISFICITSLPLIDILTYSFIFS
jgi:respiratory burst oxidase